MRKQRQDEREAARAARKAAEAQASAEFRWTVAQRQSERELYEKLGRQEAQAA